MFLCRAYTECDFCFRLRTELREVSERHEKNILEIRQDIAELKSLLLQLAQTRTHSLEAPTSSPFHSQPSLAAPVTSSPSRHNSERSSKRLTASRAQKKKHRKSHEPMDENDDKLFHVPGPYPTLPSPPRPSTTDTRAPNVNYVTPQQKGLIDMFSKVSVS